MKLMSMKQYSKLTKAGLVRKIMKALKKLPKTKLAKLCYELEKKRLPTLEERGFKPIPSSKLRKGTISYEMAVKHERRRKPRSAKQRANDKRLGLMAKRRARARRRSR